MSSPPEPQAPDAAERSRVLGELLHAVDPEGEFGAFVEATRSGELRETLSTRGRRAQDSVSELESLVVDHDRLMETMADAVAVLGPRGWAVFKMDTDVIDRAVRLIREGRAVEADDLLAEQWEGPGHWRTRVVCDRVAMMGIGEPDLRFLFEQRAELLREARTSHLEGRFASSVSLVHAQMEGIATDVARGRRFFTKGSQKADVIDGTRLATISSALAALQALYSADVRTTQAAGALSRHGIAHGRELAFGTRVNSAKVWSVLDALVEWARPLAQAEVARRVAERQERTAGSLEVDDHGRRIDDREFAETKSALRLLGDAAVGWWRRRRRFRTDLIGGVYVDHDFVRRGLGADHGLQQRVSPDGQAVWFWRVTVSGWVLGLAVSTKGRDFTEWLYAGPTSPLNGPDPELSRCQDVSLSTAAWWPPLRVPPDWGG